MVGNEYAELSCQTVSKVNIEQFNYEDVKKSDGTDRFTQLILFECKAKMATNHWETNFTKLSESMPW